MEYTHCLNAALDELCVEDDKSKGRMGRRKHVDGDECQFKSKNLGAERRRRERLSQRLLALRSLVPVITNMNKATIVDDAITYITELNKNVKVLTDQLSELERSAPAEEEFQPLMKNGMDSAKELRMEETNIIKPDVRVTNVDGNKLWMKIIFEKRSGRFTSLVKALDSNGLVLTVTIVTTFIGAVMVCSCIEGMHREMLEAAAMTELLREIVTKI